MLIYNYLGVLLTFRVHDSLDINWWLRNNAFIAVKKHELIQDRPSIQWLLH